VSNGRTFGVVVADNVRDHRALARLPQGTVADRMALLGHRWHQKTVSQVESGRRAVTVGELVSLALALGVTVGDLLDPTGVDGSGRTPVVAGEPDGVDGDAVDYWGRPFRLGWQLGRIVARSEARIRWWRRVDFADPNPWGQLGAPGFMAHPEDDATWLEDGEERP
jgi:transcriptional regulator with XRE-family HTH domain